MGAPSLGTVLLFAALDVLFFMLYLALLARNLISRLMQRGHAA